MTVLFSMWKGIKIRTFILEQNKKGYAYEFVHVKNTLVTQKKRI